MEVASVKRRYRMGARAEATAATRRSIAEAFLALFGERHYDEVTLERVAERAGVSVQTVIRHFGSKDELFVNVAREFGEAEFARRAEAPVGDVAGAIRTVVDHYERVAEIVLSLLAQEDRLEALREAADMGRRGHYDWVDRVFEPHLAAASAGERRRRRGQLVALTDIYVWKLLRRDLGFGRRQTEAAMTEMVTALLGRGK